MADRTRIVLVWTFIAGHFTSTLPLDRGGEADGIFSRFIDYTFQCNIQKELNFCPYTMKLLLLLRQFPVMCYFRFSGLANMSLTFWGHIATYWSGVCLKFQTACSVYVFGVFFCLFFCNLEARKNIFKYRLPALTCWANPLKRALVMLRRLTDPSTLQYMSFMPISLHRVMTARWQCRP